MLLHNQWTGRPVHLLFQAKVVVWFVRNILKSACLSVLRYVRKYSEMLRSDIIRPIILGLAGLFIAYVVLNVYTTAESDDVVMRMGATLMAGLYAGLLFVVYVLPLFSDLVTRLIYSDPGGQPEQHDSMHDARALIAQGAYAEAVRELRGVVTAEPGNRMAWLEMARLQAEQLGDAHSAVESLKEGLEGCEWPVDDAAFLMFRISEIHLEQCGDQAAAVSVLQQVCDLFPESRHAANATHQLRELGVL